MEFAAPAYVRDQAFGALQHHPDEQCAVDQELELGEFSEQARLVGAAEDADQHQRTGGNTGNAAHTTDDDDHEDHDRHQDLEGALEDRPDLRREDRTGERGENRADHERLQLGVHRIDAHGLGDRFVFTNRHPGATDPRVLESPAHIDGDGNEADHQIQDLLRVGALDCGDADDVGAGNRQDALCAASEAAGPVGADRESDDLTEPEGDDCEIVASHPDHRRTDEEPGDDRHEHHDEDRNPPWQLGRQTR